MKTVGEKIVQALAGSTSILITSHMQPDDDSIASVLVMYDYVATKFPNKKVEIRYSSAPLTKWQYFEHFDRIQWVDDITRTDLGGFDCIIFLDSPRFDRFTSEPEVLKNLPAIKICIDHHISPPDTFDISYIAPGPAATHHLYALFYEGESIAPRLAELLLLGILGDTVMLKHVSLQYLATYSLVGELLQKASTTIEAFTARYSLYPQKVYELVQGMIDNQEFMEIGSWPQFSASYLDRDFVAEHKATDDLIDQAYRIFSNEFITPVEEAPWGFVLYPKSSGAVGVSLRSRHSGVVVRRIVEEMQIGFGHDFAAGGRFELKAGQQPLRPQDCLGTMVQWLTTREEKGAEYLASHST